jgi:hypothetical protein
MEFHQAEGSIIVLWHSKFKTRCSTSSSIIVTSSIFGKNWGTEDNIRKDISCRYMNYILLPPLCTAATRVSSFSGFSSSDSPKAATST